MSTTTVDTPATAKAGTNGAATNTANGTHAPQASTSTALKVASPNQNAVTMIRRISDPIDAIGKLGNTFAESCMFGCNNPAQGRVLAAMCIFDGVSPTYLLRRNHIIGGRLTMKADAMLAEFRMRGGKHKILEYTPDVVKVEFIAPDQTQTFSFTWAEAQEEDYVYTAPANKGAIPKVLANGQVNPAALKDNWSTPRRRGQMLWARLVSDSVRHLMPEVNFGEYEPSEVDDAGTYTPDEGYVDAEFEVREGPATQTFEEVVAEHKQAAEANDAATAAAATTEPAPAKRGRKPKEAKAAEEPEVNISTEAASGPSAPATPPPAADGTTTHLQTDPNANSDAECIIDVPRLTEIGKLKEAIGYTREEWNAKVLAKFGVTTARALTRGNADALIPKLQEKLRKMQGRDELSKWADPRPEVPSEDVVKN